MVAYESATPIDTNVELRVVTREGPPGARGSWFSVEVDLMQPLAFALRQGHGGRAVGFQAVVAYPDAQEMHILIPHGTRNHAMG